MDYDERLVAPLRKQHHHEIVMRLRRAMAEHDLPALVLFRSDYFNWINTHQSAFLEAGLIGMLMIIVPQEGPVFGICPDHDLVAMTRNGMVEDWLQVRMWSGIEDRYALHKTPYATVGLTQIPGQHTPTVSVLAHALKERGLDKARIGVELSDLTVGLFQSLQELIPHAEFVESKALLQRAAAIKTAYEIYNMRFAAFHQWRVTHPVMMSIKPGDSYADIKRRIEIGAAETPGIDGIKFLAPYMGKTASATMRAFEESIAPGDMISIDLGFTSRGYVADSGRAYVLGKPSELQVRIADVYHEAHQIVTKEMIPGARLGDLFDMAAHIIRRHRLSDFNRGHIGHSLGCNSAVEEWPWILHGEDEVLKPNMIMTLEIPFYGRGLGAYFEEDILLITENGNESLTTPEFGLKVIHY